MYSDYIWLPTGYMHLNGYYTFPLFTGQYSRYIVYWPYWRIQYIVNRSNRTLRRMAKLDLEKISNDIGMYYWIKKIYEYKNKMHSSSKLYEKINLKCL